MVSLRTGELSQNLQFLLQLLVFLLHVCGDAICLNFAKNTNFLSHFQEIASSKRHHLESSKLLTAGGGRGCCWRRGGDVEEQRSPAGEGMDQGTSGRGCLYKEAVPPSCGRVES